MALIKDDLDIEVEETILQKVKDPKFQETDALLTYREQRRAKEKEIKDAAEKAQQEAEKPKGVFGLFGF